jgi:hypothetical protein
MKIIFSFKSFNDILSNFNRDISEISVIWSIFSGFGGESGAFRLTLVGKNELKRGSISYYSTIITTTYKNTYTIYNYYILKYLITNQLYTLYTRKGSEMKMICTTSWYNYCTY